MIRPITTSRPRSRLPSTPIPALATMLSAATPSTGLMPSSTAPAAPAKPMWEIACAAKLDPRSTTK